MIESYKKHAFFKNPTVITKTTTTKRIIGQSKPYLDRRFYWTVAILPLIVKRVAIYR